jgi:elongation factor Tu
MIVHDMFTIGGDEGLSASGLVLTGTIEEGSVTVGDSIEIVSGSGDIRTAVLKGVEIFRKDTDTASKGENVGLLFSDLREQDVSRGDVLQSL